MTLDRNDPRWTAYVLDELEPEARARFEAEMARDPEAAAVLAETREALEVLGAAFSETSPSTLTDTQREEILAAASPAPVAAAAAGRRFRNWTLAAGLAASLLIGVVTLQVVRNVPDPAAADTVVTVLPTPGDEIGQSRPTAGAAAADATVGQEAPGSGRTEAPAASEQGGGAAALSRQFVVGDIPAPQPGGGVAEPDVTEVVIASGEVLELADSISAQPGQQGQQGRGGRGGGGRAVLAGSQASAVRDSVTVSEGRFAASGVVGGTLEGRLSASPPPPPPPPPPPGFVDRNARTEFNTEEYDRITDNAFRLVADEPLSTFSVDVDTASYANVRRFLNQRTLPPPDAVRIEEMVNYFRYDYAPPVDGRPVRIHAEVAAAPWRPEHRLVRIGIQGEEIEREARASNLVFLIDVSGSMDQPDKLPLLVDGMKLLVEQLGENDRVAIVVYAGASGLVLDSTPGFRSQRIMAALDRLRAGGSTNGGAGIELAYDVAVRNFIDGGINRVILATDGDFNVGVTNNGDLTRLIEEQAETGVFLSVLGFGSGNLNDAGLEALADRGNGNYAYIDTIREARKVLVEEIGATLVTIAKDVKIQIEFNPLEVAAYRLIGYENRVLQNQDFADDTVDAGEIGSGHTVTALFEVVPVGVEFEAPGTDPLRYQQPLELSDRAGSGELLTVAVRYKAPDGDVSQLIESPVIDRGQSFEAASVDQRFAAAVAGFGMLLRDSPYRGSVSFDDVVRIGEGSLGEDAGEYRQEFVELVRRARAIRDLN